MNENEGVGENRPVSRIKLKSFSEIFLFYQTLYSHAYIDKHFKISSLLKVGFLTIMILSFFVL